MNALKDVKPGSGSSPNTQKETSGRSRTLAGSTGSAGGLSTSQSPHFSVPMRYMVFGLLGFLAFAVELVTQAVGLGRGMPLAPAIVSLTHTLTLGSLLSFVMGAVYQLSTVAFLVPLSSVKAARWNFWLYSLSVVGLIGSMATWWLPGLLAFGSLVTISLYGYVGIVLTSIRRTTVRGPVVWFIQWAHIDLAIAVTAALLMILSFGLVPLFGEMFQPLLWTHIIFATGFFTFLILGFSYKLLPMFTLSHGFSTRRQPWTFAFAQAAMAVLLAGVWLHLSLLFALGGGIGVVAFVNQLLDFRGIHRKRLRRRTETPMISAMSAVVLAALALMGLLVLAFTTRGLSGWQGFMTFYLLGWITLTVMSYAYKIVPFLVWTKRYSVGVEKGKTPLIKDMINVERARPVLLTFVIGLMVLALAGGFEWSLGAVIGAVVCALSVAWFVLQITQVIQPKKLPQELMTRD